MLLIYLLNNFQQECLLRQMDRLLEKHPYAIDAFIEDFVVLTSFDIIVCLNYVC